MREFDQLAEIVSKLRKECPWDMEQTHESLSKHLIEEAYELLDALANLDKSESSKVSLKEELGDLMLQIMLHAKIAEDNNFFNISDVINTLNAKLKVRHPHVYGDVELETAEDVEKQWEELKKENSSDSIFSDLNQNLPPISKAFKAQRKAKKLNLSYATYNEALEDLLSEVEELKLAANEEHKKDEIGDVLFAVLNVCRYLDTDPEIQLNKSTKRFIDRAKYVEQHIDENSNIDELWQEAKKNLKG
jgi:tetrapyrrole methylase family protein / MazG family protein